MLRIWTWDSRLNAWHWLGHTQNVVNQSVKYIIVIFYCPKRSGDRRLFSELSKFKALYVPCPRQLLHQAQVLLTYILRIDCRRDHSLLDIFEIDRSFICSPVHLFSCLLVVPDSHTSSMGGGGDNAKYTPDAVGLVSFSSRVRVNSFRWQKLIIQVSIEGSWSEFPCEVHASPIKWHFPLPPTRSQHCNSNCPKELHCLLQ